MDLRGFFCFKICDEIDHVTGAIFVVSIFASQIHILNVSINGNLQDEEITHMAYF